jgi:hypothetical protein
MKSNYPFSFWFNLIVTLIVGATNTMIAQQQQNQSNNYSSVLYSNPKKMQFAFDSIKEVINTLPDSLIDKRESKELNRDYNFWNKRILVENGEPVVDGEKYSKMLNTYLNNPICAPNENYRKL